MHRDGSTGSAEGWDALYGVVSSNLATIQLKDDFG